MQAAVFIVATVVLLPYAALALAFVLFDRAISEGSLWSFLSAILTQVTWLIPWGVIGAACCIVALLALGVNPATRKVGAVILSVFALASITAIWVLSSKSIGAGEFTFLLPCIAVAAAGAWLAASH